MAEKLLKAQFFGITPSIRINEAKIKAAKMRPKKKIQHQLFQETGNTSERALIDSDWVKQMQTIDRRA